MVENTIVSPIAGGLLLCSTSGVTSLALATLHQLLWAYVCVSSQLCVQWLHGGVVAWSWLSGSILPWNLQMLQVRAFFLLESWLLNIYQHSVGFGFNLIMNADNSVCWWYLLSFKSGSLRHFGKALSAWYYPSNGI